ncbi:hypothetical protein L596_027786 [Steinernema carpocapsae]|uniref:Uncharacterized protein n=1 Tax=Steinernema carpocapsae TaxID=34508 RepID=A0A4U5LWJ0_STECR|nr:hypothetical protein L596_027786 [Steinernema carpocapsae]
MSTNHSSVPPSSFVTSESPSSNQIGINDVDQRTSTPSKLNYISDFKPKPLKSLRAKNSSFQIVPRSAENSFRVPDKLEPSCAQLECGHLCPNLKRKKDVNRNRTKHAALSYKLRFLMFEITTGFKPGVGEMFSDRILSKSNVSCSFLHAFNSKESYLRIKVTSLAKQRNTISLPTYREKRNGGANKNRFEFSVCPRFATLVKKQKPEVVNQRKSKNQSRGEEAIKRGTRN